MGCRTQVMGNRHGDENSFRRGNLSFTSINLVKLALISKNIDDFFVKLDRYINLCCKQLLERFEFQGKKNVRNFPFLYGQHIWKDSELLGPDDEVKDILKHGSLAVGFIGLAEALVALTGKHHGESDESYQLGYKIVEHMRKKMDQASEFYDLNFSLIATPAEGLSGKFIQKDKEEFGRIQGVTECDYYTNSFHIPVYYQIKAIDKINKEGPFHKLCNGGHITYIECDGDVSKNLKALDLLVKAMAKS